MTENFIAVANAHNVTQQELAQFTLNAIEASFVDETHKQRMAAKVNALLDS